MTKGLIFWVLMLLWLIFGLWMHWPLGGGNLAPLGGSLLLFILLAVLGWKVFGPPVQG